MPNFTKMAIRASFIKLLNERPLNQITVKDIVVDCGINRNTFYYHFPDIPTLAQEVITQEADRIIHKYPKIESIEHCLNVAVEFALENRRAVLHVYSSAPRDVFDQCLSHVCEYWADRFIERYAAGGELDHDTRAFMTYMCRFNCSGLLSDWFIRGMKPDAEPDMHRACTLWAEAAELAKHFTR